MKSIGNYIIFFMLISFLMQILGDLQLNRYIRFYSGVIFMLLLMSPLYELISGQDVTANINLRKMWQEYEEAKNYDEMIGKYEDNYTGQAARVLVEEMERKLKGEGYEVKDYSVQWTQDYAVEKLRLYLKPLDEYGVHLNMSAESQTALRLKDFLVKTYEIDFELEVYCSE